MNVVVCMKDTIEEFSDEEMKLLITGRSGCSENIQDTYRPKKPMIESSSINAIAIEKHSIKSRDWDAPN